MFLIFLMLVFLMMDFDLWIKDFDDFCRIGIFDIDIDILSLSVAFSTVGLFFMFVLALGLS